MANVPISDLPAATTLAPTDVTPWVVSGTTSKVSFLTLQDMLSVPVPWVTPEQFGAVGNGIADDTVAIQDAFDAIATYGTIYFSYGKTYRITSQINCTTTGITVLGNNAVIDGTGLPIPVVFNTVCALNVSGTISASSINVTLDIAKGIKTVQVTSTATLADGDLVLIRSTSDLFPQGDVDAVARPGGIHFIRSVDSAVQFTIEDGALMDIGGSPVVTKITPLRNVTVQDLSVVVGGENKGQCGILYFYCVDSWLVNCNVDAGEDANFRANYCFGGGVRGGYFSNATSPDAGSSGITITSGYGVHLYSATRDFTVSGARLFNNRHGIACSGNTPVALCNITGNIAAGSRFPNPSYDIECHEECIAISITDNLINGSLDSSGSGGLMVRGSNCKVEGNQIRNAWQYGILVQSFHENPNGQDGVIVANNVVNGSRLVGIYVNGSVDCPCKNIQVIGNSVYNAIGEGIRLNATQTGVVSENIISGVTGASSSGIRLGGIVTAGGSCDDIHIANNVVETTAGYGYRISYSNNIVIESPHISAITTAGIICDNSDNVNVSGGYIENASATSACVSLDTCTNVQVSNAILMGLGSPSTSAGVTNGGATCEDISVTGCSMQNLQYAVRLTGTVDWVIVTSNNVHQTVAGVSVAAAPNQAVANNL